MAELWCELMIRACSTLVSQFNRELLYAEWRRYWNVSKPILQEKSPIHALKMRFLQAMFTTERSSFIIVLRHPHATMKVSKACLAEISLIYHQSPQLAALSR